MTGKFQQNLKNLTKSQLIPPSSNDVILITVQKLY